MLTPERTGDGCIRIVVETSMTIYEAEKLREEWAAHFNEFLNPDSENEAAGVSFDLKQVSACDITGVQLLCSARKTAELNNKLFSVSEASKEVMEAVTETGLEPDKLFSAARLNKEKTNG